MKNHCQKNKQEKGKEEEEQQEPKTVIITGGNSGLGFECAKSFLQGHWGSNWHVVLVCRDQTRALQAVQALKRATHADASVEEMACDLGSLASIRSFVENFSQRQDLPPLRAAVLNAGLQIVSKTTFTEDGFEATFGVNHLGHFLMAHLLLRHMKTPARLVFVSSGTHDPKQKTGLPDPVYHTARELAFPKKEDEDGGKNPSEIGQLRYATSKLCNVLCAYELARRLSAASPGEPHVTGSSSQKQEPSVSDISVTAFDPGLMPGTGLARDYGGLLRFAWHHILPAVAGFFYHNVRTPEASGKALARLAASPELEGVTAKYFEGLREIPSSDDSYNEEKARDLWETSIELVGLQKEETLITLS